jgi:hypothetical protein
LHAGTAAVDAHASRGPVEMVENLLIVPALNKERKDAIDVAIILIARPVRIVHQAQWVPDFDEYFANRVNEALEFDVG